MVNADSRTHEHELGRRKVGPVQKSAMYLTVYRFRATNVLFWGRAGGSMVA